MNQSARHLRPVEPVEPGRSLDGRAPPYDLTSEGDLLGHLLCVPADFAIIADHVKPDDFYSRPNMLIAMAIWELNVDSPGEVTGREVYGWLKDRGHLGDVGPANERNSTLKYLNELALERPDLVPYRVEETAKRIATFSRRRRMLRAMQTRVAESYGAIENTQVWFDEIVTEFGRIAQEGVVHQAEHIGAVVRRIGDLGAPDSAPVLPTGIQPLDAVLGGLGIGEVTTLTAPTSGGKTAFAVNISTNVAGRHDDDGRHRNGVLWHILEGTKKQITLRHACHLGRIDTHHVFKTPEKLTPGELTDLAGAYEKICKLPIYIDDRTVAVEEIRASAYRQQAHLAQQGRRLALVIVDYFQLLNRPKITQKNATDTQALDDTGKALGVLAKELGIPIVLLAQLNVEGRIEKCKAQEKHTQNWLDIRLGEISDIYDKGTPCNITVKKQRDGQKDKMIAMYFHGRFLCFSDSEWHP